MHLGASKLSREDNLFLPDQQVLLLGRSGVSKMLCFTDSLMEAFSDFMVLATILVDSTNPLAGSRKFLCRINVSVVLYTVSY